jgi:predicted TIM-barrel fold metal-dependent hydrolase
MLPSEYFRRQMYATFQNDRIGAKLLEDVGVNNALWASDYPHGDSVWPRSHETVQSDFAHVDEAIVRKITRDNGMKLYLGRG